jgi:hypothetical protein
MATIWRRRVFAALVLVTGLWTIWTRAQTTGGHGHHGMPGMTIPAHGHNSIGDGVK